MQALRQRWQSVRTHLRWSQLRLRFATCPLCGPTLLIRIADSEMGVRCLRCAASAVHLSLAAVVRSLPMDLTKASVFELSGRGPWVRFLRAEAGALTLSEYIEDGESISLPADVRNENVEQLSFPNAAFDLVTCSDVFEHVADDQAGFSEVLRVLKPRGSFVFTVPLRMDRATTVIRAVRVADGGIEHALPPEYHGDQLRGAGRVLSFRDYARDLPEQLMRIGFCSARIVEQPAKFWWGRSRPVIVAHKGVSPND